MLLDPAAAKVSEILVSYDAVPQQPGTAPVIWATVEILYSLEGMSPHIAIRLPFMCTDDVGSEACRAQAIGAARALLSHACGAPGLAGSAKTENPGSSADIDQDRETIGRRAFEGITQELGLTKPTSKPVRGEERG